MFETSVFFTRLGCIPISGRFSVDACTAICLKKKNLKNKNNKQTCQQAERGERKGHLKVKRQTSSLVFIFIFYISLNVQRVSCSIVKYLYIHMYLSWLIYLGSQSFLKFFINH